MFAVFKLKCFQETLGHRTSLTSSSFFGPRGSRSSLLSVIIITDRPSYTLFRSLLPVSGTNYHATSRLHRPRYGFSSSRLKIRLFNCSFRVTSCSGFKLTCYHRTLWSILLLTYLVTYINCSAKWSFETPRSLTSMSVPQMKTGRCNSLQSCFRRVRLFGSRWVTSYGNNSICQALRLCRGRDAAKKSARVIAAQ